MTKPTTGNNINIERKDNFLRTNSIPNKIYYKQKENDQLLTSNSHSPSNTLNLQKYWTGRNIYNKSLTDATYNSGAPWDVIDKRDSVYKRQHSYDPLISKQNLEKSIETVERIDDFNFEKEIQESLSEMQLHFDDNKLANNNSASSHMNYSRRPPLEVSASAPLPYQTLSDKDSALSNALVWNVKDIWSIEGSNEIDYDRKKTYAEFTATSNPYLYTQGAVSNELELEFQQPPYFSPNAQHNNEADYKLMHNYQTFNQLLSNNHHHSSFPNLQDLNFNQRSENIKKSYYDSSPLYQHDEKLKPLTVEIMPSVATAKSTPNLVKRSFQSTNSIPLQEIKGRIVEYSMDQFRSRSIQSILDTCSEQERQEILDEIFPHTSTLILDIFGNYVIQKLLKKCTPVQRLLIIETMTGNMMSLSLQVYGCRVIQTAMTYCDDNYRHILMSELCEHVLILSKDQNANHVIQKCIDLSPNFCTRYFLPYMSGEFSCLAKHMYGCRVVQRLIECCPISSLKNLESELISYAQELVRDQYGNYVMQHLIKKDKEHSLQKLLHSLGGSILSLSQHKFASNVIEKCLELGSTEQRNLIIREVLNASFDDMHKNNSTSETLDNDNAIAMMIKDQYANYVLQTMIDISDEKSKELIYFQLKSQISSLKKFKNARHILAKFPQANGGGSCNIVK